jgi:hypothetical protein
MEGMNVLAVSYEASIAEPQHFMHRVCDWLPDLVPAGAPVGPAVSRLSLELWHHRSGPSARRLLPEQSELLDILAELAGPYREFAPPQLPPPSPWAVELLAARRELERLHRGRVGVEAEIGRLGLAYRALAESVARLARAGGQDLALRRRPSG